MELDVEATEKSKNPNDKRTASLESLHYTLNPLH